VLLAPLGIHLPSFLALLERDCLRPRWTDSDAVMVVVIRSGSEGGASGYGGSCGDGLAGGGLAEGMLTEHSLCRGGVFHGRGGVNVEISWG